MSLLVILFKQINVSRNGYEVEHICKDGERKINYVSFGTLAQCLNCGKILNAAIQAATFGQQLDKKPPDGGNKKT